MANVLVTGCAGFIGFHLVKRLAFDGTKCAEEEGRARVDQIVGLDSLNDYYDVSLKAARLAQLTTAPNFHFCKVDLADREGLARVLRETQFEKVVHLAAQAGVRYSLTNPEAYVDSNLLGFANLLEGCRERGAGLVYPSTVRVAAERPPDEYALSKRLGELGLWRQYAAAFLCARPGGPSPQSLRGHQKGQ